MRRKRPQEPAIDSLILRMHEAALDPSLWPEVLSGFASLFNARMVVIGIDPLRGGYKLVGSLGLDESQLRAQESYYSRIDPFISEVRRRKLHSPSGYSPSHLLVADQNLERTECYQDYMRPLKLHYGFGCTLIPSPDHPSYFGIQRDKATGSISDDDEQTVHRLLPHLRHAARLTAHLSALEAERDISFSGSLDAHGRAVFLLDETGRILRMNQSAERIARQNDGLSAHADGLRAATSTQTAELRRLIFAASEGVVAGAPPPGATIALPRPSLNRPYAVTVTPISNERSGWRFGVPAPTVAVIVLDPSATTQTNPDIFKQVFGLTGAEALLAAELSQGSSLSEASAALSITRNTARTHLQHLFQKTATRKQGELVALLARTSLLQL